MELARRAAQRGEWDLVLKNLDLAEKGGYPDKVEIDIGRIPAGAGTGLHLRPYPTNLHE